MLISMAGLIGLAPSATADTVSPSTAPVLRFLTYNICGSSDITDDCTLSDDVPRRVQKVADETLAWKTDLLFLQEVCQSQYDALLTRLADHGYTGHFVVMKRPGQDPRENDLCKATGLEGPFGVAVLSKAPVSNRQSIDLTTGLEDPTKATDWRTACIDTPLQGRLTRACSVHLYSYDGKVTKAQAGKVADKAKEWSAEGIPMVLGGDFNPRHDGHTQSTAPRSTTLDSIYSKPEGPGSGQFIEADSTDTDYFDATCRAATPLPPRCRSGEPTLRAKGTDPEAKLDYIFLSESHFKNVAADALPRDAAISDHYPYRSAATWDFCNSPADGRADLLRRDSAGDLWRHFGRADGTLQALHCKVGAGWSGMRHIARGGDHDGDGHADLYAIDAAGDLYFYPGHRTELFFIPPRKVGWGWGPTTTLVSAGDMNGDGKRDLVARFDDGKLYLVPGTGNGEVGPKAEIGHGWQIHNLVLAPGDVTGDAKPDVLARNAAGELWAYPGTGTGFLGTPTEVGFSWQVYNAVAAPGDVNGDGKPDLLARDAAGDVWFYAGTGSLAGSGPFAARVKSGWGFPTNELIA
ncbi:FG-GAP-like repeat-containing protein [Streptomyces sp. NPDC020412]|uniref:FG-GAP-like repeat-containing protein n=1 Tax=Streptomyces sp. NPDC020412 TaxID=3365073 RepID=UPI0037A2F600